jgi:hypothetical protein
LGHEIQRYREDLYHFGRGHGGRPADDGAGPTGPRARIESLRPDFLPNPESDAGGGPRSRNGAWMPDPENGGPVGPHARAKRLRSLDALPNPDDPLGGGGPRT